MEVTSKCFIEHEQQQNCAKAIVVETCDVASQTELVPGAVMPLLEQAGRLPNSSRCCALLLIVQGSRLFSRPASRSPTLR